MPAWAAAAPDLVYTTNRDGGDEIWLRQGSSERMLLGQAAIPGGGMFQTPALSPHADRIAYVTLPTARGSEPVPQRLWLAAVVGGPPVPLTTPSADYQSAPCWSPDGNSIAYLSTAGPTNALMIVPATGGATPRVLKPVIGLGSLVDMTGPAWSPDGKWIAYEATDGLVHLIAPDGGGDHVATTTPLLVWTFSADSRSLYGIVQRGYNFDLVEVALGPGTAGPQAGGAAQPRQAPRQLMLRTVANLGRDAPAANLQPGYHLTLAPDGNTVTYTTGKAATEIDLVEPFDPEGVGMARVRHFLHLP
jgi:Tol biopolymer transport system component